MPKCVACDKQVPDGQSRCPHCGAEVRLPIVATARRATPARVTDSRGTPSLSQTSTWTHSTQQEVGLPATKPRNRTLRHSPWLWLIPAGLAVAVAVVLLLPAEVALNENGYLELRVLEAENIGRGMSVSAALAEALTLSGIESEELVAFEESLDIATRSRLLIWVEELSLVLYEINSGRQRRLTESNALDSSPVWSPDGGLLYFLRDQRTVCVLDLSNDKVEIIAEELTRAGRTPTLRDMTISGDGRTLYIRSTARANSLRSPTIFALDIVTGECIPLDGFAGAEVGSLTWLPEVIGEVE